MFKLELVDLVLGFQGEDLIVGVLAEALAVVATGVVSADFLDLLVDLA